jgi:RNase P protein component
VRRSGARIRVEYLDVRAMPSALPHARVGFVVPKYGHSSADRNRLKRRLRELVRTRLLPALRSCADAKGSAVPRAAMRAGSDADATDGATDAATDGATDAATDGATDAATDGATDAATNAAANVAAGAAGSSLPPIDVVVRALPAAYDAPFSALAREVGRVYEGVRGRMAPVGG